MPGQPVYDSTAKTAARNAAVADLVNANGTGDGTIADVSASFVQATLNNNFRDVSDKINAILAALRNAGIISN